ncbi:MAG: hypothetical protein WCD38_11705 [Candidatus Tumulicola sp.]
MTTTEEIIDSLQGIDTRVLDGNDVDIADDAQVEIIHEHGKPVGAWVEARIWVSL